MGSIPVRVTNFFIQIRFYGVLAQLGARHTGSVEVTGSNPVCSIKKVHNPALTKIWICKFKDIYSGRCFLVYLSLNGFYLKPKSVEAVILYMITYEEFLFHCPLRIPCRFRIVFIRNNPIGYILKPTVFQHPYNHFMAKSFKIGRAHV